MTTASTRSSPANPTVFGVGAAVALNHRDVDSDCCGLNDPSQPEGSKRPRHGDSYGVDAVRRPTPSGLGRVDVEHTNLKACRERHRLRTLLLETTIRTRQRRRGWFVVRRRLDPARAKCAGSNLAVPASRAEDAPHAHLTTSPSPRRASAATRRSAPGWPIFTTRTACPAVRKESALMLQRRSAHRPGGSPWRVREDEIAGLQGGIDVPQSVRS